MKNGEKSKPSLSGIFFTKSGQILTRPLKHAAPSIVIPMNTQDSRLFIRNGEIVQPFVAVTFRHVRNVPLAAFTLAIYEETASAEFNPEGLIPAPYRSLEKDFEELNEGLNV